MHLFANQVAPFLGRLGKTKRSTLWWKKFDLKQYLDLARISTKILVPVDQAIVLN